MKADVQHKLNSTTDDTTTTTTTEGGIDVRYWKMVLGQLIVHLAKLLL